MTTKLTYSITLKANPAYEIGFVWQDDQGLWRLKMNADEDLGRTGIHLEDYTAGPFATRGDAEIEAYDVWGRVCNMRWKPRR